MKKILFVLSLLFICNLQFYSQETESQDFDDLDILFNDSEDVEPVIVVTPAVNNSESKTISVSGNFTADVGLCGIVYPSDFDISGYLNFKNNLNINIRPNDVVQLHGTIETGLQNNFNLNLSSFYFDYLFLNKVYISAGKKGVSWGYLRLFDNTDYYSGKNQYCNILYDSSSYIIASIKYPWSSGTFTFVPMCSFENLQKNPSYKNFHFAASLENIFYNTSFNLFARTYGFSAENKVFPVLGLEVKKTLFGYDVYGQSTLKIKDWNNLSGNDGYDFFTTTIGFYRLWDSSEPHFGINLEYQFVKNFINNSYSNKIALEGGIKRLGANKNHKIGVKWHHDFEENTGIGEFAYIISGIFAYANWTNGCKLYYTDGDFTKLEFATAISLDLNY